MAWRSGSLSRTLLNTARSPAIRPSAGNATAIPRSRRPASPLLSNAVRPPRTFSFTNPRTVEVLGCVQSLMPLHSVMADASLTSHIAVSVRAWCELSQGT